MFTSYKKLVQKEYEKLKPEDDLEKCDKEKLIFALEQTIQYIHECNGFKKKKKNDHIIVLLNSDNTNHLIPSFNNLIVYLHYLFNKNLTEPEKNKILELLEKNNDLFEILNDIESKKIKIFADPLSKKYKSQLIQDSIVKYSEFVKTLNLLIYFVFLYVEKLLKKNGKNVIFNKNNPMENKDEKAILQILNCAFNKAAVYSAAEWVNSLNIYFNKDLNGTQHENFKPILKKFTLDCMYQIENAKRKHEGGQEFKNNNRFIYIYIIISIISVGGIIAWRFFK